METTVQMPSRGLFEGSVAEIVLREMTVKEEKGLFSAKKPFVKMMDLIRGCAGSAKDAAGAYIEAIDINKWPLVDMTHALFKLRMVSIDPVYEFNVQCATCGQSIPFGVDLDQGLETAFAPEGTTQVYTAKLSFGEIMLKHLLVSDQIVLDRLIRQRHAKQRMGFDQGYTLRLAAQIVGLDGEEFGSIATAETWVETCTSRQREEIGIAVDQHSFGDDLILAIECPSCGALDEAVMPITRDFLFRRQHGRGAR